MKFVHKKRQGEVEVEVVGEEDTRRPCKLWNSALYSNIIVVAVGEVEGTRFEKLKVSDVQCQSHYQCSQSKYTGRVEDFVSILLDRK